MLVEVMAAFVVACAAASATFPAWHALKGVRRRMLHCMEIYHLGLRR